MAIFVDDATKVVVQGITGRDGGFHTKEMMHYGTKIVAGVTPGRGGQKFDGTLLFNPGLVRQLFRRHLQQILDSIGEELLIARWNDYAHL